MNLLKTIIPNAGQALIAEAIATAQTIIVTRMVCGTGTVSTEAEALDLLEVVSYYADMPIIDQKRVENITEVTGRITNSNVLVNTTLFEYGVYAKLGELGSEILLAYTTTDDGLVLPDNTTGASISTEPTLAFGITELASVSITVELGGSVPNTRRIEVDYLMTGAGDLSQDLNLSIYPGIKALNGDDFYFIFEDTDLVEAGKIYIDTRTHQQWLILTTGEFNAVSKLDLSLSGLLSITSKLKPRYSISCVQTGNNYAMVLNETRPPYTLEKFVFEVDADSIGNDTATINNGTVDISYTLKKQDSLGAIVPIIAGDLTSGVAYAGTFGMNTDIIVAIQSFNVTSTTDAISVANGKDLTLNTVDNLTTPSATKPLSANMGKLLKDDEWKINAKIIGNTTSSTDLDFILEKGFYKSDSGSNLFTNLPPGKQYNAFSLTVGGIADAGRYGTQTLFDFLTTKIWHRVNKSADPLVQTWSAWVEIMTSDTTYTKSESDSRFARKDIFSNNDTSGLGSGTTYTNTTGKPMFIAVSETNNAYATGRYIELYVNGVLRQRCDNSGDETDDLACSVMVPPGATYKYVGGTTTGTARYFQRCY